MSISHDSPSTLTSRLFALCYSMFQTETTGSTDQVIICMLGFEHSGDILQVVRVDLLWTTPGKGHSDDTFCDICEVEFISLLHPKPWGLLLKTLKPRNRWVRCFYYLTPLLLSEDDFTEVNIWWSKSSALVTVCNFPADTFREWPQFLIAWQWVSCLHCNSQQCVSQILHNT